MAFDCIRPLFGALVIAASVVSLLATSLFLIPIAVWLAVRWSLIAPTVELEDVSALGALRRSGRLSADAGSRLRRCSSSAARSRSASGRSSARC